jgi:hypothetical protein
MNFHKLAFLMYVLLLTCTSFAYGQQINPNKLPNCPRPDYSKQFDTGPSGRTHEWSNCWGRITIEVDPYRKGDIFEGEWQNGNLNGIGIQYAIFSWRGAIYTGEFKNGFKHGKGFLKHQNGLIDGECWQNDGNVQVPTSFDCSLLAEKKRELESKKWINPNNFPSCLDSEPLKHNCWAMGEANGIQYEGEWKNGLPNGFGRISYPSIGFYEGSVVDGSANGFGNFSSREDSYIGEMRNNKFHGQGILTKKNGRKYEGIWEDDKLIQEIQVSFKSKNIDSSLSIKNSNLQSDSTKNAQNLKRIEEGLAQNKEKKRVQQVHLKITHSQPNSDGVFYFSINANADTASLKINGEEQGGRADGNYSIKRVARVGQDTQFTIAAVDVYGNSDTKTITVTRQATPAGDTSIALKPEAIKRAAARDAVAIIIGIQDYKRVPKAEFANNDAKEFYEYAIRALGIKQEKIKMLLDDEADEVNIVKAFENWLPIQVNKGKTDVYVFYSGHGLPAPDGKSLYFLPHGVDKELLSRTAVSQNEIVAALSAAKPKSVTMFIDACYSGQTRGGDVLVANAKPLSLKSDTNGYPPNFTVITASANDQISSSSPELKHGIFSFYLMKGMEGDADANKDGKITVGEMQDYLSDKVSRQAMTLNRKQTTQFVGDTGRVLITR